MHSDSLMILAEHWAQSCSAMRWVSVMHTIQWCVRLARFGTWRWFVLWACLHTAKAVSDLFDSVIWFYYSWKREEYRRLSVKERKRRRVLQSARAGDCITLMRLQGLQGLPVSPVIHFTNIDILALEKCFFSTFWLHCWQSRVRPSYQKIHVIKPASRLVFPLHGRGFNSCSHFMVKQWQNFLLIVTYSAILCKVSWSTPFTLRCRCCM